MGHHLSAAHSLQFRKLCIRIMNQSLHACTSNVHESGHDISLLLNNLRLLFFDIYKGHGRGQPSLGGETWLASSSPQSKLASCDVTALFNLGFGKEASGAVCD
jgi:hypothetical protein